MNQPILVSTRKGLFTIERTGRAACPWAITRTDFLGDNVSLSLKDPRSGNVFAALDHGHFGVKLHRSEKIGDDWIECAAPSYPEKPDGEPDVNEGGQEIPWSLQRIWALETGGTDKPDLIWCGTIPGGLFKSTDQGESWQIVSSLWDNPLRKQWFGGGADYPGIHSICVDPRNSDIIRLAISCGGVWKSDDGGENWNSYGTGIRAEFMPPELEYEMNVQDAHRMVQCPSTPDKLWIQHHNGIFKSDDGGANWQEIKEVKPSTFGFAVAVHPKHPETAWFIPGVKDEKRYPPNGQLVVTRTTDGGKTFEILRDGLPQLHAYDIVYRHGLDISASGDELVFGTTTGGLWISENQGDNWFNVSNNLPPIHAVRFS